ncbi:MAG: DNA cytosine methyltransferase [Alphaproteobacteria bacterium]|jgi:DNA (cytosine-5)-methyltransferase 1|nr:DNA cytosine methyltransferase [Alphaproteobacteria bacterium]MBT4083000.1 DNA cytosine methyltransferase [Alphaproteobacteria bacterium]
MEKLTCIDLFAGAGGLSIGLEMSGFECLYANEVSSVYSETLAKSHPNALVETKDIRAIDASEIREKLGLRRGQLSLLVGGPPCQGFSVNAPVRSKYDDRNHLFRSFLDFVEEFQPSAALIENVPGIISYESGQTIKEILRALSTLGYEATVRILYAAHYGVPQMRWRTIITANRIGIDPHLMFPIATHRAEGRANFTSKLDGKSLILNSKDINSYAGLEFSTVWDAISDLPEISNGGGSDDAVYAHLPTNEFQKFVRKGSKSIKNHICARLGKTNLDRFSHIPQGGSWRDIPHDLLPEGMKRARRSDHTKRYGRLHPTGIGSTILTKCDPHWGTYVHPFQDRVLSVREAARIQSFPDRIHFVGTLTKQYQQVGNAVPPLFAKAIGDRIIEQLFSVLTEEVYSPWILPQMELSL